MTGTCESCGREDVLDEVVRVYVVTEDDGSERVVDDEHEHWCSSCQATYPHRSLG